MEHWARLFDGAFDEDYILEEAQKSRTASDQVAHATSEMLRETAAMEAQINKFLGDIRAA